MRRCKKNDLKRIAKATGATFLTTMANLEGDESFDASMLGTAEEVIQERISDDELILIKGFFNFFMIFFQIWSFLMLNIKAKSQNSCIDYFKSCK